MLRAPTDQEALMRFDVPGGSSLVFSDAEGRVLDRPEVQAVTRTVQVVVPGVEPV